MSYSRKKLTGGLKTCLILCFLLYPWKFQTKQSFSPRNSTKLCYTTQKFKGLKPRPLEIVDNFFLIILGNFTSLLIKPWKFYLLFLQYLWKVHILNCRPSCLFFSGITQSISSISCMSNKLRQSYGTYRTTCLVASASAEAVPLEDDTFL